VFVGPILLVIIVAVLIWRRLSFAAYMNKKNERLNIILRDIEKQSKDEF